MLGDSSDVPPLLKIWRESNSNEYSVIWLGAMRNLYWKNHMLDAKFPVLTSLSVNFSEKSADAEKDVKLTHLLYQIDNPASAPRFIRVSAHFWKTLTKENIPAKYYWLPAGGSIESSMQTKILSVSDAHNMRLDFRIWEVGIPEPLLHQTVEIPFPVE